MGYIYALCDPVTEEIRYIGKTIQNPHKRYFQHLSRQQLCKLTWKNNWITSLLEQETFPLMVVIEECENNFLSEREIYWISYYSKTCQLTNATVGGDGGNTARTPEAIEKKSKNLSLALRGKPKSPKEVERLKRINVGRTHTDEWKKEMTSMFSGDKNPFYGKHHTEESRKKMSNSHSGYVPSESHRKSLGNATRNKQPKYGFYGVSPSKNLWRARFFVSGKVISCGSSFKTPEDAALAYDHEVVKWVENPPLNFRKVG